VKFRIVAVGRPRRGAVGEAIREYEQRAGRYWPLEVAEVRAESGHDAPPALVRRREAERLADRATGTVIACDEHGTLMTSAAFAVWLGKLRREAADVSFAIGGAFGLDDALLRNAAHRLALARWTLSHDLARLVLAEQLYRAGTIVRGEPYHK
jgi:23S rRNA (pseudouridine1915-N3)-methyltransferase